MNEKPQKCLFNVLAFFRAWEEFDTTAWNSYCGSIYCASTKVES